MSHDRFFGDPVALASLDAAITTTLADHGDPEHLRQMLFRFARELKAMPCYANAGPLDLTEQLRRWHQASTDGLPAKDQWPFDETLSIFAPAWNRVTFPAGQGPIDKHFAEAAGLDAPQVDADYDSREVRHLARLCILLQRSTRPGEPFFLAGDVAGKLFRVHHSTASRWLNLLVLTGFLQLVSKGQRRRASEYRCPSAEPRQHEQGRPPATPEG